MILKEISFNIKEMTLSDSIFDAIAVVEQSINEYSDYSGSHKKELIATLAVMYNTSFNISGDGGPKNRVIAMTHCRRIAEYKFNKNYYGLTFADYKHCEGCVCTVCVDPVSEEVEGEFKIKEHDHSTCKSDRCVNMSEKEKRRLSCKKYYHKRKEEIQAKRKVVKEEGIKRKVGRPAKEVKETPKEVKKEEVKKVKEDVKEVVKKTMLQYQKECEGLFDRYPSDKKCYTYTLKKDRKIKQKLSLFAVKSGDYWGIEDYEIIENNFEDFINTFCEEDPDFVVRGDEMALNYDISYEQQNKPVECTGEGCTNFATAKNGGMCNACKGAEATPKAKPLKKAVVKEEQYNDRCVGCGRHDDFCRCGGPRMAWGY